MLLKLLVHLIIDKKIHTRHFTKDLLKSGNFLRLDSFPSPGSHRFDSEDLTKGLGSVLDKTTSKRNKGSVKKITKYEKCHRACKRISR